MNGKKTYLNSRRLLKTVILILFAISLLNITACKTKIETLPVHQDDVPVRQLENGNYEVTPGYVLRHTAMMAQIKILKQKLEECRGGK